MVEEKVELHRPLGPSKLRPIEQARAQIDDRGVQAHELVLESELPAVLCSDAAAAIEKLVKDGLEERPRTVFVGVGECRAGGSADPQMYELALAARQPAAD